MSKLDKSKILEFFLEPKKTSILSLIVSCLTFGIRYLVCWNVKCAMSYGIWALLIANLVFILFQSVMKTIKAVKSKKKQTDPNGTTGTDVNNQ